MPVVFLDTNVLVDLYMSRPRLKELTKVLLEINGQLVTSVLSVEMCSYIASQEKRLGLVQLQDFIAGVEVLAVTGSTLALAFRSAQDEDLEDALQVACALENRADIFVTADRKLADRYGKLLNVRLV